ncbi:STAS domain-containing protein (plasmid) [Streptomyces sp. BH-SS-21]|uniref:STAS domain-containing protein n=1 Tax=Streptomyces liliiviolaceus TaxID=2823109 RepID=A0A941B9I4_9ACTN|nr:STAS domain-containing protein [Streptomyces liliiviolaceus]
MTGEIDLCTAVEFAARMNAPSPSPAAFLLIVDLRGVSFMDSSGVRELSVARTRCLDRGGWTRLVYSQRSIHVLLTALRLTDGFPRYATTLDARMGRSRPVGPWPREGRYAPAPSLSPAGSG